VADRAPRRLPGRDAFTPRGWLVVLGGAITGALVLFAWLPLGALMSQGAQLDAAQSRIAQLSAQSRILTAEAKRLTTPVEAERLAREEYQLVAPGQRLMQVLTPSGTASHVATGGPFPGDPGFSALVVPSASALAPSIDGASSHAAARHVAAAQGGGSFFSRVLGTLEFWR